MVAKVYNPDIEAMNRDRLVDLQLKRLKKTVKQCDENVLFYRQKLRQEGVTWKDVKSLQDITRLPFTTRDDLYSL